MGQVNKLKQRKLAFELRSKTSEAKNAQVKLDELNERKKALILQIRDAEDGIDLDAVDLEIEGIEIEVEELKPKIVDLDKEVEELNKKLDAAQDLGDESKEDEEVNKDKIVVEGSAPTAEQAERAALNTFIRSKGQERAGLTSIEGEALIPVDRKVVPVLEKGNDELNLGALINTVPVSTASGTYPILKKTKAVLNTVAELAKNPDLANPDFDEVDFKVETYRGAIPISQEAIDDSTVDLVDLVEGHVDRMSINTDNVAIATLLKAFTKKAVANVDEIKAIINVALDPAYTKTFILSQSFYQLVDTVKDNNDRYLFQESIVSPSGFTFLNRPVYIAADTQLGTAGKATGWVGDLKEAVTKFDRKQIGARWVDNTVYGQFLQAGKRMQIKTVDSKSGFYMTADALTVGPVAPAGE